MLEVVDCSGGATGPVGEACVGVAAAGPEDPVFPEDAVSSEGDSDANVEASDVRPFCSALESDVLDFEVTKMPESFVVVSLAILSHEAQMSRRIFGLQAQVCKIEKTSVL